MRDVVAGVILRGDWICLTQRKPDGTGQAIRIAKAHGIPVWNLQRPDHRQAWESIL